MALDDGEALQHDCNIAVESRTNASVSNGHTDGETGFLPWQAVDSAGRPHWLVRVPQHVAPYLCRGAGFWPAADELQSLRPPRAPVRSFAELY